MRSTAISAVTGAVALALLAVPAAAHADVRVIGGHQPTADTAVVRAAHFSPDTPGVDVYLTAFNGKKTTLVQSDVGYGDVTPYHAIKPGLYVVAMRLHGAKPTSPAGLSWTLHARAGKAYTAAAEGMNKHLTGVVLADTLTAPAKGHGLVRVIQAASRAPRAKLVAGPNVIAADAKFATSTKYASVPAGNWHVTATALTRSLSTTKQVTVKSGSINSLVVLDSKNKGIQLRTVADASGAAVAPQGSIDAGGGGTARPQLDGIAPPAYAGVAVLLVLGAAVGLRRRQVTRA